VKIQSGDTLAKLAQRELGSAARYQEILKANPGLVATKLQKGQEIKIPVAAAKPATDERSAANAQTQVTPQTTPVVSSDRVYTVKKGDTLSSIAAREMGSKAKWQELLKANEDVLHGSTALKIDMKLQIPGGEKASSTSSDLAPRAATESTAPAPGERDYVVKPGDSLWLIAKNEMGSEKLVGALREANEGVLKGSDSLKVGTTLRIPARQ
jgi:nucleoid-associated protein YgaU